MLRRSIQGNQLPSVDYVVSSTGPVDNNNIGQVSLQVSSASLSMSLALPGLTGLKLSTSSIFAAVYRRTTELAIKSL